MSYRTWWQILYHSHIPHAVVHVLCAGAIVARNPYIDVIWKENNGGHTEYLGQFISATNDFGWCICVDLVRHIFSCHQISCANIIFIIVMFWHFGEYAITFTWYKKSLNSKVTVVAFWWLYRQSLAKRKLNWRISATQVHGCKVGQQTCKTFP